MMIKDLLPWTTGSGAGAGSDKSREGEADAGGGDHPMAGLQRELNRAFEGFLSRFDQTVSELGAFGGSGPRADMVETATGVEVTVELPGVDQDAVDVSVTEDMLTIRGEKKVERQDEKTGYVLSERSYGAFSRSIALPRGVDPDKAEAQFKNGLLTITLPRAPEEQERARKVHIRTE